MWRDFWHPRSASALSHVLVWVIRSVPDTCIHAWTRLVDVAVHGLKTARELAVTAAIGCQRAWEPITRICTSHAVRLTWVVVAVPIAVDKL